MRASAKTAMLATATFLCVAGGSPRGASAAAVCSFEEPNSFSPGVSMTAREYTFTTGGQTGKITCNGDIAGQQITGPGTLSDDGRADGGSSCLSGTGTGEYRLQIPTTGGRVELQYPYFFSYTLGLGFFGGRGFQGSFNIVPTKGNCLTSPVTEARLRGMAQLVARRAD